MRCLARCAGVQHCLDAPWAPANSCLLVAAALPEELPRARGAQGRCSASVWVFVSLLPSSALELSNAYLYRNKTRRRVRGISHQCLAFCFSLEPLGGSARGWKVKWKVKRVQSEAQQLQMSVGEKHPC